MTEDELKALETARDVQREYEESMLKDRPSVCEHCLANLPFGGPHTHYVTAEKGGHP